LNQLGEQNKDFSGDRRLVDHQKNKGSPKMNFLNQTVLFLLEVSWGITGDQSQGITSFKINLMALMNYALFTNL